jgi:hypothetical protein
VREQEVEIQKREREHEQERASGERESHRDMSDQCPPAYKKKSFRKPYRKNARIAPKFVKVVKRVIMKGSEKKKTPIDCLL